MLAGNVRLWRELREVMGGAEMPQSLLTDMAGLQELMNTVGKKGGAIDITSLFRAYTSQGMTPQQARDRIGADVGLAAGGILTGTDILNTMKALGPYAAAMPSRIRDTVLPLLETVMPSGQRMNVGRGLREIFEKMTGDVAHEEHWAIQKSDPAIAAAQPNIGRNRQ